MSKEIDAQLICSTGISRTRPTANQTLLYNNTSGLWTPSYLPLTTGRATAQTAAVASIVTTTVGSADSSFILTSNVNVTTSTTHNFTVQCDYTDETNAARTITLNVQQVAGTIITAITAATGVGPYHGITSHIRAKAATTITLKTSGTFTTVVYNVEASIIQLS